MNRKDLEQSYIERDGHIFTPIFTSVKIETGNGETEVDYTIVKSAEEAYQDWLANKDRPSPPTDAERLEAAEAAILTLMEVIG